MRHIGYLLVACLGGVMLLSNVSRAQSFGVQGQLKPSDGVLYNVVMMDCAMVKQRLKSVHSNDGLSRVNAGQLYDSVANKLMARFNSKIAERRLDGGSLFAYAAQFEERLGKFREAYRTYETSMVQLIRSDCDAYPQNFYYLLDAVRVERQRVQQEITMLHKIAQQYKQAVHTFAQQFAATEEGSVHEE